MAPTEPAKKDRFINRSGGWLGVLVRAPGTATGFKGVSLYPGQDVDLDEEEQSMTANAPRDPRGNALANGSLELIAEGMNFKGRRPLRPDPFIAVADPNNPATWSEDQRENVESERMKLEAERQALADAMAAQVETGQEIEPGRQPAVGEFALFEEQGVPSLQPPVVPGSTIQGGIETPTEGEPAVIKASDDLDEDLLEDVQEGAVSVVLGPADRVGHVPGSGPRKKGRPPGSTNRVTATP